MSTTIESFASVHFNPAEKETQVPPLSLSSVSFPSHLLGIRLLFFFLAIYITFLLLSQLSAARRLIDYYQS